MERFVFFQRRAHSSSCLPFLQLPLRWALERRARSPGARKVLPSSARSHAGLRVGGGSAGGAVPRRQPRSRPAPPSRCPWDTAKVPVKEVLSLGSCCGPRNKCPCFCPCPAAICSQCSGRSEHFKSSFRSCAAPLKTLPQLPARLLKSWRWRPQPPRVRPRSPPPSCLLLAPVPATLAFSVSLQRDTRHLGAHIPAPSVGHSPVCAWPLPPCLLALLACHLLSDARLSFSRPPLLPTSFFLPYPPLPLVCISLLQCSPSLTRQVY